MFQFTTETIINSNLDSNGVSTKFSGANNTLSVLRVGNFKKSEVVSVYKRPYSAAVNETLVETISGTVDATKTYRLVVELMLQGLASSDFADHTSFNHKNIFIEVSGVATAADLATAFKTKLANQNLMTGFNFITLTNSGAAMTFTATNSYIRFKTIQIQELLAGTGSTITGNMLTGYDNWTLYFDLLTDPTSWTKGVEGFGTVAWITKNLRLPTYENVRFAGLALEERPIPGGQYTQYSIRVSNSRTGIGLSAVGQQVTSITDHIFYVESGQVSAWETALSNAGLTLLNAVATSGNELILSTPRTTVFVGEPITLTLEGAVGEVTYVAGDTHVTIADEHIGVAVAATAGTVTVTATDALGKTGSIALTVLALA